MRQLSPYIAACLAFTACPVAAQDMIMQDFVTPQIGPQGEVDRQQNRQLQQQRNRQALSPSAEARARDEGRRIMQSHQPRLEREYNRRVQNDGKASANQWLKAETSALAANINRQMRTKYAGQ